MKKSLSLRFYVGFWAGLLSTGVLSGIDKISSLSPAIKFIISTVICCIIIMAGQHIAKEVSDD